MTEQMIKDLDYYTSLPYTIEVTPLLKEEGGGFHACVPDLGRFAICGDGETRQEAIEDVLKFMKSRLKVWIKEGVKIREPKSLMEKDAEIFAKTRNRIFKINSPEESPMTFEEFAVQELDPQTAKKIITEFHKMGGADLFNRGELRKLQLLIKSLPELPDDSDESDPDPAI